MKIGVVGATGVVGREMIKILIERGYKDIETFASPKSNGKTIKIKDREFTVKEANVENLNRCDLLLWATSSDISRNIIPLTNAVNIDNSSAFRMEEKVPLIIPEINGNTLTGRENIVANPNCSTAIMLMGILPFIKKDIIDSIFVSTYQSVSGAGYRGIKALEYESNGKLYEESPFPYTIHNNIIPFIGNQNDLPWSGEEIKMIEETRKITGKDYRVFPTCVRVPVFRSHSESVTLVLKNEITTDEINQMYSDIKGVRITETPSHPEDMAEKEYVSVSRIRMHPQEKNVVSMWIVGDNLWKGAALNAVQILDFIIGK